MIFAGQTEKGLVFEAMEPPKPIFTYQYQCGSEFYLQPLEMMLRNNDLIGIISIDNDECAVGILDNDMLYILGHTASGVPGKSSKGGSSARRYERNRNSRLNEYYHRAALLSNDSLSSYGNRLKKIVVSGPSLTPETFLGKGYLDYRLKVKISKILACEYAGRDGLWQTRNKLTS